MCQNLDKKKEYRRKVSSNLWITKNLFYLAIAQMANIIFIITIDELIMEFRINSRCFAERLSYQKLDKSFQTFSFYNI